MQILGGGQGFGSGIADFTFEPGFHLVGHREGQGGKQHGFVGLRVEGLHLPRLSAVGLDSPLPAPLQDWRRGHAVEPDGAVHRDELPLCGCQRATDDWCLWSVCR